ncbi:hypothetical protein AMECASPLE_004906 [Ameca splendens]|uniref:Secreted protein n=1 Tax=Ameca splendens TaxID=208324 RepID=A0ABV0XC13_9TELE
MPCLLVLLLPSGAKSTCLLQLLDAVCCGPSTVLATPTTLHFQLTNSLTYNHSTHTLISTHTTSPTNIQIIRMVQGHTNTGCYYINLRDPYSRAKLYKMDFKFLGFLCLSTLPQASGTLISK